MGLTATLTILFVAGTSTVLLSSSVYYDQTVFLLPASLFVLWVTALFVRWTRTGTSWLLVASWLVFTLSFVTQERPLVVPVYLVILRYLILPYRVAPGGSDGGYRTGGFGSPSVLSAPRMRATTEPSDRTPIQVRPFVLKFVRLAPTAFLRAVIGIPIDTNADRAGKLLFVVLGAGLWGGCWSSTAEEPSCSGQASLSSSASP